MTDYFPRTLIIVSYFFFINFANSANEINNIEQQNAHQREQQKALQSQLNTTGKNFRSEQPEKPNETLIYVDEPSCAKIISVKVEKDSEMPHWLPMQRMADKAVGHCMNTHNIKTAVITLQNRLISSGFITSRVGIPEQNINNGHLILSVVSGLVGKIKFDEKSDNYIHTGNTFPTHLGKILDLRDIEQGLENMQNIPSTNVHINLVPSDEPGRSDIVLQRSQPSFWRIAGWTDDSGSKYTGRYQAGVALYLDNPTSLNDLFYISAAHDLQNSHHLGSKNSSLNYTIPYGYWSLNLYASENEYHQPLSEQLKNFQYQGKNKIISARLSRVLHRGAQQKTTFSSQVIKRDSHYYISDTELELQKINLTNLRFDLAHRHYIGNSVIDADLSWQRNTHWLGSKSTASAEAGIASDISRIMTFDLQALIPFELAGINMSYQPHYYQQYSPDQLISQDKFSIGNRWTVRGFDGENSLMGNRGWYFSNTLNINLPENLNNQFYMGIDYGQVSQISQEWISGHTLAGGVVGVRGFMWYTGYDLFASTPLSKPDGLVTNNLNLGFTLQWTY